MGQEIKMQGGASGVYRPEGSHTPHMVPTKPEVVKQQKARRSYGLIILSGSASR